MVDVGKYIWLKDDQYSWVPGKIIEIVDNNYRVEINIDEEEDIRLVDKREWYSEVHPSCLTGVDDLLMWGDFNQQTLLHNTRERFSHDKIYSFIGMPILIAVNPYKKINKIYSDDTIRHYKDYFVKLKTNPNNVDAPIPHWYYLAEAAYRDMLNDKKNQSIIISGESGSGKTESTKIILKYLAVSSLKSLGAQDGNKEWVTVEKQVLDSNPLWEAFGNAKTVKNNNSSRFGKFIQVSFTEQGKILSARIFNYLLEKSRVVNIQKEERNYHIFYQFLLGADEKDKELYKIKEPEYFSYLNQGCYEVADTDDAANFKETLDCMQKLTFTQAEITFILNIWMGILYLGNVNFEEKVQNNNTIAIIDEDSLEDFSNAAYFLGISNETLQEILTIKKLTDSISKQDIKRFLSVDKAYNCREAISKALYAKMFDYIVGKINRAIANKDESTKYDKNKIHKIGWWDIFGFENFESNSFEQLCINYANERLQQYFNNHIFKLEQEEYKREGIDWTQVEFVDNNDIIELIDANKISIFGLLDSEGITPNANDTSFRNNVYRWLTKNEALGEEIPGTIVINHYAGIIDYNIENFVEKNLDQLTNDITEALMQSKNKWIKRLFEGKEAHDTKGKNKKVVKGPNKWQSDTLSKQFKLQLDELLLMLSQSNPRYVKCIKPNSWKAPKILDSIDVMDQLLCAGVLEAIKIRKQGYSIRRSKDEFYKIYRCLTPSVDVKQCKDYTDAVNKMLKLLEEIPEMKEAMKGKKKVLQVGHSKVFMKEEIKTILDYKWNRIKYIYWIQSTFRALKIRRKVRKILNGVRTIQKYFRGKWMREFFFDLRNVTKQIQRNFRHFTLKKRVKIMIRKLHEDEVKRQRQREKELLELKTKEALNKVKSDEDDEEGHHNNYETSIINQRNDAILGNGKEKSVRTNGLKRESSTNQIASSTAKTLIENNINISNYQTANESSLIHIGKNDKPRKHKKSIKTKISTSSEFDFVSNTVDIELKKKLDSLAKELEQVKTERDTYKLQLEQTQDLLEKEKELKSSNEKSSTNLSINLEVKKLQKEINEKDTNYEVLTLQLEELTKANKSLTQLTESLKLQGNKRKEKFEKETNTWYQQIQQLEIAKNEYERRLTQDTKEERDSKAWINFNSSYRTINELKNENKTLQKKLDDLKLKYSNEISQFKSQIAVKEYQLNNLDGSHNTNNEEFNAIKKENEFCKAKWADWKIKLEAFNNTKRLNQCSWDIEQMKAEFEEKVHNLEFENNSLKEDFEKTSSQIDKLKKIEKVLRSQICDKEIEIENYKNYNEETREENDKLIDENMQLKKDNYIMKSKLEVIDAQYKSKNDSEIQKLKKIVEEMKIKESSYWCNMEEWQRSLNRKGRSWESKKKMNLWLIDLAKIKKSEVHCIEGLNWTNSEQLKEALNGLRSKETAWLTDLGKASKEDEEISDSENENDEEDEDDEEYNEDEDGEDDGGENNEEESD